MSEKQFFGHITENLSRAHRVSSALKAGTVWVNCFFIRDLRTPFGGVGDSGVGREGGNFSREFFTEPKAVDGISRKLGVVHYLTFGSEAYLKQHDTPGSLFEYYKHRIILHEGYVHQVERWIPKIAELRKMIDYAFITNSAAAMIETCANGGGIAVLPSYFVEVDNRLKALELPEMAPIQFWITYTERVRRLPHGKAVLDWIWSIFDERKVAWFRDDFVHPSQVSKSNDVIARAS